MALRQAAGLAALLTLSCPAVAQEPIQIDPREAAQCAVWASMIGGSTTDPQQQAALTYALNYFMGQYEGRSGRPIIEALDEKEIVEVAENVASYSQRCAAHMQNYGGRMVNWGAALTELGDRLQAGGTTSGN